MKHLLDFLIQVGKLKGKKRRGWVIHKINNPETTAEHIFHLAIFVWLLGKSKKINLERAIKMALVHDLCEIYSPDFTSFDAAGLSEKGRLTIKDVAKIKPKLGRPTPLQRKKLETIKNKLEARAMKKLLSKLPPRVRHEIDTLWREYEDGSTPEGRFVQQADKMINFLQGIEYWKKYGKIQYRLWTRRIKETIDDPSLIDFLEEIDAKFFKETLLKQEPSERIVNHIIHIIKKRIRHG